MAAWSRFSPLHDDVHHTALADVDHLARRLAVHVTLRGRRFQCDPLGVFLADVRWNLDAVAHLTIDLHDQRDLILGGHFGIVLRPRLHVDAALAADALPQFLAD